MHHHAGRLVEHEQIVVIEVHASQLSDGFTHLSLNIPQPGATKLGCVLAILSGSSPYAIEPLAKELGIPVIVLSQLSRVPERRTGDHRPQLSDLRESGSIEQDADMVLLLHREDAYERESPRAGEADFILAKHRNGPTANITVAFQGHYSRFVDMAQA